MKNRGLRFHRIRHFKQYNFNSIPPRCPEVFSESCIGNSTSQAFDMVCFCAVFAWIPRLRHAAQHLQINSLGRTEVSASLRKTSHTRCTVRSTGAFRADPPVEKTTNGSLSSRSRQQHLSQQYPPSPLAEASAYEIKRKLYMYMYTYIYIYIYVYIYIYIYTDIPFNLLIPTSD